MAENKFASVTPDEMLREEFLAEYELSQNQLTKTVGISPSQGQFIMRRAMPR